MTQQKKDESFASRLASHYAMKLGLTGLVLGGAMMTGQVRSPNPEPVQDGAAATATAYANAQNQPPVPLTVDDAEPRRNGEPVEESREGSATPTSSETITPAQAANPTAIPTQAVSPTAPPTSEAANINATTAAIETETSNSQTRTAQHNAQTDAANATIAADETIIANLQATIDAPTVTPTPTMTDAQREGMVQAREIEAAVTATAHMGYSQTVRAGRSTATPTVKR